MMEDLPSSYSLGHLLPWQKPDQMKTDLWELFLGIGISNISTSFESRLRRFLGDVFNLPLVVVSEYLLRRKQMRKEETVLFFCEREFLDRLFSSKFEHVVPFAFNTVNLHILSSFL